MRRSIILRSTLTALVLSVSVILSIPAFADASPDDLIGDAMTDIASETDIESGSVTEEEVTTADPGEPTPPKTADPFLAVAMFSVAAAGASSLLLRKKH